MYGPETSEAATVEGADGGEPESICIGAAEDAEDDAAAASGDKLRLSLLQELQPKQYDAISSPQQKSATQSKHQERRSRIRNIVCNTTSKLWEHETRRSRPVTAIDSIDAMSVSAGSSGLIAAVCRKSKRKLLLPLPPPPPLLLLSVWKRSVDSSLRYDASITSQFEGASSEAAAAEDEDCCCCGCGCDCRLIRVMCIALTSSSSFRRARSTSSH